MLFPGKRAAPVLMSSLFDFDASSAVRLHSSLSVTPFNPNIHHREFCPRQLRAV